ncbi:hypothetical protein [Granulicella sibirica]|nr:hypothetical protein [Granulicella sibirica]
MSIRSTRQPWMYVAVAVLLSSLAAFAQVDVLTQHNDPGRTGANLHETVLNLKNVNQKDFGLLFKHVLDDQIYAQPLLATNISIDGGTHDLVFLTTVNNSVYAFDANDPAATAPVWHVNFGTPANLHDADFGCFDINGKMGILGAPVLWLKRDGAPHDALYVVALTRTGGGYQQRLHALDLATGADLPESPTTITAPGFDPLQQSQRPALTLANGMIYVGYASHCDKLPYHGYLLGYDARTLQQTAVLNTSPTGQGATIWQSGQAPAVDAAGNIYVVTANGDWDGVQNFSESFLKLDAHLKLLDWFTPTNHVKLDQIDADLGSSGPTLIPGTRMIAGGGKEGVLYAVDADRLGHLGDEHAIQHFQATASHLHSLVFWESAKRGGLLYVWGQRDKARVYHVGGNKIDETPVMTRPEVNEGHPGAMLSLSANNGHDGILWAAIHATGDSWHESRPGILHAYDADDVTHELWNSLQNPARDDCGEYSKMAPPTIANGKVYLASFGTRNIGTGQFCVYGLLPAGLPPAAPTGLKTTVVGGAVALTWLPVPGAHTYTVRSIREGKTLRLAGGLTTPIYSGIIAELGSQQYTVSTDNANGESAASVPVEVTIGDAPPQVRHH